MLIQPNENGFIKESSQRLNSLRMGIRAMLASVPGGGPVRTSVDLERWLGVNKKVAWQLFRFNQAGVCLADARHLPTATPFRNFIAAAVRHGADESLAKTVFDRYRNVEEFISEECGTRQTFESMISEVDRNALADVTARQKRAMHEAACHLWGIRAAARFSLWIVFPSETDPDYLDFVHLDGLVGLHCQRGTRAWPVTTVIMVGPEGAKTRSDGIEPLDPDAHTELGVPLIRRFSSDQLPTLEMNDVPEVGLSQVLARFHDMGRGSSMDLTFGFVARRVSVKYRELNEMSDDSGFVTVVRVPCDVLVSDFLVHQSIGFLEPSVHTLAFDANLPVHALRLAQTTRLPMNDVIEDVGMGSSLLAAEDRIPNYSELIEQGLQSTKLSGENFRAYHCQVEHPIVSTMVAVSFPMPSMTAGEALED